MATSTIVWTPVPAGRRDGALALSVLVSPRLSGTPGTLGGYPEWLSWPAQRPRFSVVFGTGPAVPAVTSGPGPRLDLWQRIFPADTPVLPKPAALRAATVPPIRSWPSAAARNMARAEHAAATAYAPTTPPSVNEHFPQEAGLAAPEQDEREEGVLDIRISPARLQRARALIAQALERDGYFLGGPLDDPEHPFAPFTAAQVDFLLAEQFHHRQRTDNPQPAGAALTAHVRTLATGDDVDFHAALGALAQYPSLQRALGLVVDLTVDPAAPGVPASGDPVAVALRVDWPPLASGAYEAVLPSVNSVLSATAFTAKPAGTLTQDGLLRLGTEVFDVVEIDPDASASALSGFSRKLHDRVTYGSSAASPNAALPVPVDPGAEPAPLPSQRSEGLSVVQHARAKDLHAALTRATARAAAPTTAALAQDPFSAEELNYGVRVDVWDDVSGKWHSLCRRDGTYHCGDLEFASRDEGTVHLAHTQAPDGDPTVYLHESLFTWDGYSLAATRPGSITRTVDGEEVTVGPDSEPTGPVRLRTSFRARELPKLRYGRGYRFRARTVDVAGNGPGPDEPAPDDFTAATPLARHLRFDPVGPPTLLPTAPRTQAESIALLVVRGNYDAPATGSCERHVTPQRISQSTAERHGMYDVRPGPLNPGGVDRFAYAEIVRRDKAAFDDGEEDPGGWSPAPYYDGTLLEVPYLPDVLARGAAFTGLPGLAPGEVFPVAFDDRLDWPRRAPFRLRLESGTGAPEYNEASRVLTVRLPPGRSADVICSSRIAEDDLDVLGVWQWFTDSGLEPPPGTSVDDLRRLAALGQLWQLTPGRPLRLVHAIRQPLLPPVFGKPVAVRAPGETSARIVDVLSFDRASSAKVEVRADWTEQVDSPAEPGPLQRAGRARVATLAADPEAPEGDRIRLGDRQEFHDTRHRMVTYTSVASSRFTEFFTETRRITLTGTDPVRIAPHGIAPGTLTVIDPADGHAYAGADYVADPAAGTVRRSGPGSAIPDGATVEAGFVDGPVTRANSEAQPPVVVDVRSSARPAAPDVAYLVPTFGWERTATGTSLTSTRHGNGIRVYLRRPWYSSGDDEVLGVVLAEGGTPPPPALREYVTLRGEDPLFASAPTPAAPGPAEFPLAHRAVTGLVLAASDTVPDLPTVTVAPHAVGYDASRRLWYCDITMTQERAYHPFLRFALVRYQRHSLSGLELSPVVLTQFAQLGPDRTLSVVFGPDDPARAAVTVAGATYAADPARAARLTLLVQTAAGPAATGALGWQTAAETPLPPVPGESGRWSAAVTLPGPRGSRPMRLVVEERETLPGTPTEPDGGTRLVYADAVEI